MADTVRTDEEILDSLADNTTGGITAQTLRDLYVTVLDRIAAAVAGHNHEPIPPASESAFSLAFSLAFG